MIRNIKIIKNIVIIGMIFIIYIVVYNYPDSILLVLKNLTIKELIKNLLPPVIFFIFLLNKKYLRTVLNSYILFILLIFANTLTFGRISFKLILHDLSIAILVASLLIFIYQIQILKKLKIALILNMLIALLLCLVPLIITIYSLNFNVSIEETSLYAICQTNYHEAYEYIYDFIKIKYIVFFFIVIFCSILLLYQENKKIIFITKQITLVSVFLFCLILTFLTYENSDSNVYTFVFKSINTYQQELQLFKKTQEARKIGKIKFSATKKLQGETYVVIIGESLNKKHMGIYGYFRNTTPYLSSLSKQGELVIFNNAYSNHTHTTSVLSQTLTESNQYNQKSYYKSLSIIEILKKANIETYWLTNQSIYGAYDNMVSVIALSSDHIVALNKSIGKQTRTQRFDGALINEFKKVLTKKSTKNRVIFIHLMGSHGSYTSRYPKKFAVFSEKLKQGEFGDKASKVSNINNYDNSVLYNDFVVASILKEFQQQINIGGLIYLSDHADDVIRQLGHNSGKFTFEMTQIPMIAWFSKVYKKTYPKKYHNLFKRKNSLFSNDMLYNTMIGMFDISTDKYNTKYDFTNDNYFLNSKNALTLHGKKKYADKDNYIYWQKENAKYLINSHQANRIFPHKIDSIGKLRDIWNDGFRSFEVDVIFENGIFQVGHNHSKIGVDFEVFLNSVDYSKIKRIWLDFRNLNKDNYKNALKKLQYLNEKFNIKNKFIVASSATLDFVAKFSNNGWHTSYYLPTEMIVSFLKNKDVKEMQNLALKISKQTKIQSLSAVSFDSRVYSFVKKYLESIISVNIVYHIWYAPNLYDIYFKDKLLKNKPYLNRRIKTLLGPYISQFNL